jgi:hypothetical protein
MSTWRRARRRARRRTRQRRTRRKIKNRESCYENDENLRR